MLGLWRASVVRVDEGVEGISDLTRDADLMAGQPHRKVSGLHGMQRIEQLVLIELGHGSVAVHSGLARAPLAGVVSRFRQCSACLGGGISSPAAATGGGRILIHDRSPSP